MAFTWNRTRCSPIGIDFGTDSLKLLQVTLTDPPQIIAAAASGVPEEARNQPAARQAFFADALRDLLRAAPFKGRRAVASIPATQMLVQHLQIARAEHEDLDAQVGLHLRQRLNLDPARMVVRSFEVATVVRDNTPRQELICFAAAREAVMQQVELMNRAKLDVVGMHGEAVLIVKAFAHLYRRATDTERTTCFIDLGAGTTKAVIAHGAQMVFAKTIHAAGDHLTRHRAQREGLSFTAAREARAREAAGEGEALAPMVPRRAADPAAAAAAGGNVPAAGGLAVLDARLTADRRAPARGSAVVSPPPPPPPGAATGGAGTPDEASDTLDCLIDELQLCVRYHQSLFPQRPVEKLVFLGGESRHTRVCQKIARALRIGAQAGDPLARLLRNGPPAPPVGGDGGDATPGVDLRVPQPGWAVPVGLCLSEPQA